VIFMDEPGTAQLPPRRWRMPARVLDVVLATIVSAVALAMVGLGRPGVTEGRPLTWRDAAVTSIVFGLVLVRRRWPLPILLASTVLAVITVALGGDVAGFVAVTVIAAYTVGTHTNRRTAWLAGGTSGLVVYAAVVAFTSQGWLGPALGVAAWVGMATAIGDATRSRRAYVAAVEERARRAEETREEEARRRVAEERIRIARDLHDVVAHHIAVINVHAGLAEHTVRTKPEQAEASLGHVRQAAQTVLAELTTILSVLRQNDDGDAPTEPVRGLSQLGELLDSVAATGLRVEHRQVGDARPLPAAIDLAAYRIVQEALTNAHKHGTGHRADLRIEYRPAAVVIDVGNPAPLSPGADREKGRDTGHGLTGMRERAIAVGGSLDAGLAGTGRFHVHAVLPSAARAEGVP